MARKVSLQEYLHFMKVNKNVFISEDLSIRTNATVNSTQAQLDNVQKESYMLGVPEKINKTNMESTCLDNDNKESEAKLQELDSLIKEQKQSSFEINTKIKYINENISKLRRCISTYQTGGNAMDVHHSVQKEFIEAVEILIDFCMTFEEKQEHITTENKIDWENLFKIMTANVNKWGLKIDSNSEELQEIKGTLNICTPRDYNTNSL